MIIGILLAAIALASYHAYVASEKETDEANKEKKAIDSFLVFAACSFLLFSFTGMSPTIFGMVISILILKKAFLSRFTKTAPYA